MSLRKLLRHEASMSTDPIVTGYDDFGEPITEPGIEVRFPCRLESVKAIESRDGGLVAVDELRLYLPPDVDPMPTAADRIKVNGVEYSLAGNPRTADNPRTNRVAYLVATVRYVT